MSMTNDLFEQLSTLPEPIQQEIARALTLSEQERRELSEKLKTNASREMTPEVKAKWVKILEERRKAYEEGRSKTYTKEEFMKRLRERVDEKIRESSRH